MNDIILNKTMHVSEQLYKTVINHICRALVAIYISEYNFQGITIITLIHQLLAGAIIACTGFNNVAQIIQWFVIMMLPSTNFLNLFHIIWKYIRMTRKTVAS